MNINGSRIIQQARLELFGGKSKNSLLKSKVMASFDKSLLNCPKNEWENFEADFERLTSTLIGEGGVNIGDMRALYSISRGLEPLRVLEVGTHLGFSTSVIAAALQAAGAHKSIITTVDISDVNCSQAQHWLKSGSGISPTDLCNNLAPNIQIDFEIATSVDFIANSEAEFDFVFLDGSHDADVVFKELSLLGPILSDNSFILLHDYFPNGKPLWSNNHVIYGPYLASEKFLKAQDAHLQMSSLSPLPWETKLGSCNTSLACITHDFK